MEHRDDANQASSEVEAALEADRAREREETAARVEREAEVTDRLTATLGRATAKRRDGLPDV